MDKTYAQTLRLEGTVLTVSGLLVGGIVALTASAEFGWWQATVAAVLSVAGSLAWGKSRVVAAVQRAEIMNGLPTDHRDPRPLLPVLIAAPAILLIAAFLEVRLAFSLSCAWLVLGLLRIGLHARTVEASQRSKGRRYFPKSKRLAVSELQLTYSLGRDSR